MKTFDEALREIPLAVIRGDGRPGYIAGATLADETISAIKTLILEQVIQADEPTNFDGDTWARNVKEARNDLRASQRKIVEGKS